MFEDGLTKYSSITFDVHDGFDTGMSIQTPGFNYSGAPAPGGSPCQFTICGRIRVSAAPQSNLAVFSACTGDGTNNTLICQLWIDTSGHLTGGFGTAAEVTAPLPLADGQWHFVGISFAGNAAGGGELKLFVDGVLMDDQQIAPGTHSYAPYRANWLGHLASDPLEFSDWNIWSTPVPSDYMMAKDWTSPAGFAAAAGLVGAWDFSSGRVGMLKADGWQFTPWYDDGSGTTTDKLYWNVGCTQMAGQASLAMPAGQPFMATSPGAPFTLMGWMGVGPDMTGQVSFLESGNLSVFMRYAGPGKVVVGLHDQGSDSAIDILSDPLSATPLHMIALTNDGTTISLYADGALVQSTPLLGLPANIQPDAQFLVNRGTGTTYLEGLSLWNSALSVSAMIANGEANDPFGTPGCLAWVQGATDLADAVSSNALVANGAAPVFAEARTYVPVNDPGVTPPAGGKATRSGPDAMDYADYLALAQSLGIDIDNAPSNMKRDTRFQTGVDYYAQALQAANVDRNLQVRLNMIFARNYAIGLEIADRSPQAGRFHMHDDAGALVMTYHDGCEHHEVGRFDRPEELGLARATTHQVVKLICDILALTLTALGAVVSTKELVRSGTRAATRLAALAREIEPLIAAVPLETETINQAFVNTMVKILQLVRGIGLLGTMVWDAIIASWWSFAWTVASIVLQIIGLFVTAGWSLLIRLAQMAIGIYTIYVDIRDMIGSSPFAEGTAPSPAPA
ncbi:MAG TPA: LamG-like jellyroll fold domain-containing protein [Croceibacterium sp.]